MTRDNLRKRHIIKPLDCVYCCEAESVHHLFFDCIVAKNIWKVIGSCFNILIGDCFELVAEFWLSEKKNSTVNLVSSAILWSLWKHRNSMIFDNVSWISINQIWKGIQRTLIFWMVLATEDCKRKVETLLTLVVKLIK